MVHLPVPGDLALANSSEDHENYYCSLCVLSARLVTWQ